MFTGIVEDMGTVVEWSETAPNEGWLLKIIPDHPEIFFDGSTYIGASICVSGVCLTVTAFDKKSFEFGVAPETIRRTNFGDFKKGKSRVNLERAALSSGRNSGHYVQGHVDDVGVVMKKWEEKETLWFKIGVSKEIVNGIVTKGFIAVEGTSLTVCEVSNVEPCWFTLMLIHHTQHHVVIPLKEVGEKLNLELDVMVKYSSSATQDLRKRVDDLETKLALTLKRLEEVEAKVDNKKLKLLD